MFMYIHHNKADMQNPPKAAEFINNYYKLNVGEKDTVFNTNSVHIQ